MLMASGWEWWRRHWCGLPVLRWCQELPVPAALLPSPEARLSPHYSDVPVAMGQPSLAPSHAAARPRSRLHPAWSTVIS